VKEIVEPLVRQAEHPAFRARTSKPLQLLAVLVGKTVVARGAKLGFRAKRQFMVLGVLVVRGTRAAARHRGSAQVAAVVVETRVVPLTRVDALVSVAALEP
jgi:hypothetical protein